MSTPSFGELLKDLDTIAPVCGPDGGKLPLSSEQSEQLRRIAQASEETGDALELGIQVVGKLMAASTTSELPMDADEIQALGWFIREVSDVVHCLKNVGLGAEYRAQAHGNQ
ncbi:hypothetical protein [Alcanivorax sediminis]|uniref:Uncharacterized protein n=1 Tax=Alcanivorax sediminis TaxID=2663008 RepID=A0A6N7LTX3_9GAMM|nr:hypothetical protein [Alcanivorax sediminis]MQX53928.1 hypothetical protein [Alcanivorax sediminis]